jgi:hypothetical protein
MKNDKFVIVVLEKGQRRYLAKGINYYWALWSSLALKFQTRDDAEDFMSRYNVSKSAFVEHL